MKFVLLCAALASVALGSATARNEPAVPRDTAGMDSYQIMRQNCANAGEDGWIRCQRSATSKDGPSRAACNDNQERARRMCMLDVLDRQHRDIHGPGTAVVQ